MYTSDNRLVDRPVYLPLKKFFFLYFCMCNFAKNDEKDINDKIFLLRYQVVYVFLYV